jgi:hypothetical protein
MYTQADSITSDTSLAPFSSEEVASMLSLMDPLMNSAGIEHEYAHEHSVWIVARFMGEFCHVKFVNFCGQPGARLNADQSLYGDHNTRSNNILLRVMNIILFGSPNTYNKAVQKIWVDSTIVQPRWKNFINRLNSEWNGYTIFSTVMLAVDISFLAVPFVQTQMAAILVSYMSTLCAMGSLVVSLVLAGQVNDSRRDSAKSVDVEFCARPREPCPHAQSSICSSDLGNGIFCCSVIHRDFQYFWCCHHLDYISHLDRYLYSSDMAGSGFQ